MAHFERELQLNNSSVMSAYNVHFATLKSLIICQIHVFLVLLYFLEIPKLPADTRLNATQARSREACLSETLERHHNPYPLLTTQNDSSDAKYSVSLISRFCYTVFMGQHLHVELTDADRQHLEGLIRRGISPARVQTRARILLLSDRSDGQKRSRQEVAEATLCNAVTVGSVCRRFVLEGLDSALTEKPRPGQAPKVTGDIEAKLIALVCSDPPAGRARWTLRLLASKMVELGHIDSITNVTIGERLKKMHLSPGK